VKAVINFSYLLKKWKMLSASEQQSATQKRLYHLNEIRLHFYDRLIRMKFDDFVSAAEILSFGIRYATVYKVRQFNSRNGL
jgi:hypothetical protein